MYSVQYVNKYVNEESLAKKLSQKTFALLKLLKQRLVKLVE